MNLAKEMQGLYAENYKAPSRKIKEDIKYRKMALFMNWKTLKYEDGFPIGV